MSTSRQEHSTFMSDQSIKTPIRAFMSRSFEGRELADDDDIFALGFGNSLFAVQLVNFVEGEFSIEIEGADLDIANFRTINALSTLVQAKVRSRA